MFKFMYTDKVRMFQNVYKTFFHSKDFFLFIFHSEYDKVQLPKLHCVATLGAILAPN